MKNGIKQHLKISTLMNASEKLLVVIVFTDKF